MSQSPLFYKYLDERGVDLLKNLRLLANPPSLLNDPFECDPLLTFDTNPDRICEILRSDRFAYLQTAKGLTPLKPSRAIIADIKQRAPAILAGARQALSERINNFRVACLSLRRDGILLWAHYTGGHRGFVVGLKGFALGGRAGTAVCKVRYSADRPSIGNILGLDTEKRTEALLKSFQTKSEEWQYEEEVRIIGPSEAFMKFGDKSYFSLEPAFIDCVIIGSRCPPNLCNEIDEALRSNPDLRHVRKLRANVEAERFAITIAATNGRRAGSEGQQGQR